MCVHPPRCVGNKWWWIFDKQRKLIDEYSGGWGYGKLLMTRPPRGLFGKWESMLLSFEFMYRKYDEIREFAAKFEHAMIALAPTVRKDAQLLHRWMSNNKLTFEFMCIYDWHEQVVQPNP